ncbi:group I intron-associated PD-(D/E)XK endonuclease [Halobium palmae]|uniref:Group I intron-associated PD-(D/E)XK endonuclease n=1 Tax=Halobium palmae TaxID=1776492 RepID=A0ABD5S2P3_9EURY
MIDPTSPSETVPDTFHPKSRGQRSEAAVLQILVEHGLTVLQPFGDNERYDLVVEENPDFYRLQVKTGRLENGRVQFDTRSSGTLTRSVEKETYEGQIDQFVVYAPELREAFVVAVEQAPETTMGLRVADAKKSSPNINRADEFEIDDWIASIES